jgi:hypothetical protein
MSDEDFVDKAAHHLLADQSISKAQSYLKRGRIFEATSDGDLRAQFISAFREYVVDLRQKPKNHEMMNDLQAEYDLRGIEPPYEELVAEMKILKNAAQKAADNFSPEDEEAIAEEMFETYLTDFRRRQ